MNAEKQFEKYAFTMKLKPGHAQEYQHRHDKIWPELSEKLRQAGISDYSIFLEEATHTLFAVLWRTKNHQMEQLPEQAIMRRWWEYMADLMETHPDGSPQTQPLKLVFHMN